MWGELQELLAGFVIAVIALMVMATILTSTSRSDDKGADAGEPARQLDADFHEQIENSSAAGPGPEAPKPTPLKVMDGPPSVATIFIAEKASAPMQQVNEVMAIARRGLDGDRYCEGCGFWSEKDECEITMISQHNLDDIRRETGINLNNGAHRRNIVVRNIAMESLAGKRFQIGSAQFAFERQRPPCLHLQQISEPGMVKALAGRSGICIRCFHSGIFRQGDAIIPINISLSALLKNAIQSFWGK